MAVINTGLVQDALDDELNEAVVLRRGDRMRGVDALPVTRQEFLHQRMHLPETLYPGVAGIPVLVLQVVRQPRQGEQQTQTAVLFLGRSDLLKVAQYFNNFLHGVVHAVVRAGGDDVRLRLDAQQLDVLVAQDRVRELPHVEIRKRLQGLDELQHVVPLSVEDQLTQEEHVVAVLTVYHAGLALQRELRDVKVTAVEELQGQSHHVLLAQRQMRRRHHVPNTQPVQITEQSGELLPTPVASARACNLRDTTSTKFRSPTEQVITQGDRGEVKYREIMVGILATVSYALVWLRKYCSINVMIAQLMQQLKQHSRVDMS